MADKVKINSFILDVAFESAFRGVWSITVVNGMIDQIEQFPGGKVRDLERYVRLTDENSRLLADIDIYVGVGKHKLEIKSGKRGQRYDIVTLDTPTHIRKNIHYSF